jgi:hypothetical protein
VAALASPLRLALRVTINVARKKRKQPVSLRRELILTCFFVYVIFNAALGAGVGSMVFALVKYGPAENQRREPLMARVSRLTDIEGEIKKARPDQATR